MAKATNTVRHKKRGRPATTGTTPMVAIRLSPDLQRRIDEWAAKQPEPLNRSDAMRHILDQWLESKSGLKK